jgi:phosphatidylglycerophosphate synthase
VNLSPFGHGGTRSGLGSEAPAPYAASAREYLGVSARSVVASSASLGVFALLAGRAAMAVGRPGRIATPANLLTLSRVGASAWLCGYAANPRPGRARTVAWLMLLWGATVTDWLDGPLARRYGPTALGAMLDLEADSWLTLWAAVAAWRGGSLPAAGLTAPILRYAVRWRRGFTVPMATDPWQKAAGAAQMAVLAGALAPFRPVRALARALSPLAGIAQLIALAADSVSAPANRGQATAEQRSARSIQA